ncbi:MAG: GPR endopeptidase, partial [Clostridia bacterium]|nr:GPR endopeptidase [Clostridia bacterium]
YLGIPVIAIGVPTVVDALCLATELTGVEHGRFSDESRGKGEGLVVAPKDIDLLVKNASYLLAMAINCALQPTLTPQELYALM